MLMYKIILLALAWVIFFEGKTTSPNIQVRISDEAPGCSLPPPKNIHWTNSFPTYFLFEWDPVPGAAYFRVKVFRSPSNTMIYSKMVPALPQNNAMAVDSLTPGTNFTIEVHSVCSNGVDSPRAN